MTRGLILIEWCLGLGLMSGLLSLLITSVAPLHQHLSTMLTHINQQYDRDLIGDQLYWDLLQAIRVDQPHSHTVDLYLHNGERIRYEHIGTRLSRKKNTGRRWYMTQYLQIQSLRITQFKPSTITLTIKGAVPIERTHHQWQ